MHLSKFISESEYMGVCVCVCDYVTKSVCGVCFSVCMSGANSNYNTINQAHTHVTNTCPGVTPTRTANLSCFNNAVQLDNIKECILSRRSLVLFISRQIKYVNQVYTLSSDSTYKLFSVRSTRSRFAFQTCVVVHVFCNYKLPI